MIDYDDPLFGAFIYALVILINGGFIALLLFYVEVVEPPKVILPTTTLPICITSP